MRYLGRIPIMIYVCMWNHTMNNVRFLLHNMSNEHGHPITQINKLQPFGGSYCLLPTFYTSAYVYFTNSIVSSLASGRPINAWQDIFIKLSFILSSPLVQVFYISFQALPWYISFWGLNYSHQYYYLQCLPILDLLHTSQSCAFIHFSPFLRKCTLLGMCFVLLASLTLLAIQTADLLSNILPG